jgi:DNA-binding response OmpR family regulator
MSHTPQHDIPAVTALHDALGLTAKEAEVLVLLARGGIVENHRICEIYCDNPHTNPIEARSAVKRIRKKIRASDSYRTIAITSHYGIGYELEPESIIMVRAIVRGGR